MRIAWLEQSGIIEDRSQVRDALAHAGIDYYRMNWRFKNDPFAEVKHYGKRVSWSKGRELLYAAISHLRYDYYVFADDDIAFGGSWLHSAERMRSSLEIYKPHIYTVRSASDWQESLIDKNTEGLIPVFLVDLQLQCYARHIAEFAFPVRFDGGWGTLWYPMLHANKLPGNVLSDRDLIIYNTRRSVSGHYGGVENNNIKSIWFRSRPFMGRGVFELSEKIGIKRTIIQLNKIFGQKFGSKNPHKNQRS